MSRKIEVGTGYLKKTGIIVVASLLMLPSLAAVAQNQGMAMEPSAQRLSATLHFSKGGRGNKRDPAKGGLSVDQYAALRTEGGRSKSMTQSSSGKSSGNVSQGRSFDFWIFDADVELFYDDDADGYYHGIDLLFDADTIFSVAEVYAAVYLSLEGGPWNEYAVTDDFVIFGASGSDEYNLVTELMSGYPTGNYDLLIELFDANDGTFLASFGPEDTSALAFLPLEDFNHDAPVVGQRVTVSHGGGGTTGIWMLLTMFAVRLIPRRAG